MCKSNGESVNHLHIHCPITMELWFMVFTLYGIHWVMLKIVVSQLEGKFGRHCNGVIWKAGPHCLM